MGVAGSRWGNMYTHSPSFRMLWMGRCIVLRNTQPVLEDAVCVCVCVSTGGVRTCVCVAACVYLRCFFLCVRTCVCVPACVCAPALHPFFRPNVE